MQNAHQFIKCTSLGAFLYSKTTKDVFHVFTKFQKWSIFNLSITILDQSDEVSGLVC